MEIIKHYIGYKDIVELALRKHNIHEGIWSVFVEFKTAAINAKIEDAILPAYVLGVASLGIFPAKEESNIAFDAAKLNPPSKPKGKTKAK